MMVSLIIIPSPVWKNTQLSRKYLAFVFCYNCLATSCFVKAQFLSGCLCVWLLGWWFRMFRSKDVWKVPEGSPLSVFEQLPWRTVTFWWQEFLWGRGWIQLRAPHKHHCVQSLAVLLQFPGMLCVTLIPLRIFPWWSLEWGRAVPVFPTLPGHPAELEAGGDWSLTSSSPWASLCSTQCFFHALRGAGG